MELIVDANILFSFFRSESFTREMLKFLHSRDIRLVVPEFGLDELFSKRKRICEFSRIDEEDFILSFTVLCEILEIVSKSEFEDLLPEAKKLLPEHPEDAPYFALALKLSIPIWSNEQRFKRQSKVRIFSTHNLKKELSFG